MKKRNPHTDLCYMIQANARYDVRRVIPRSVVRILGDNASLIRTPLMIRTCGRCATVERRRV